MVLQYAELAIVIGVVMALIELLKKGLDLITKQFNKGSKDSKQEVDIAVLQEKLNKIECNDLHHLKLGQEKNAEEHERIIQSLTRVEVTLELMSKEKPT